MLTFSGRRTEKAGARPAPPSYGRAAMLASPVSVAVASGTAKGGSGVPGATPVEPLGVVSNVLIPISASSTIATAPTYLPYRGLVAPAPCVGEAGGRRPLLRPARRAGAGPPRPRRAARGRG